MPNNRQLSGFLPEFKEVLNQSINNFVGQGVSLHFIKTGNKEVGSTLLIKHLMKRLLAPL